MNIDVANIGDKLELEKTYYSSVDAFIHKKVYQSQLLDIIDSDKIKIAMPMSKGRMIYIGTGDEYIMYIYTEKDLYMCRVIVEGRSKEKKVHVAHLKLLSKLVKIQRRQYYRLTTTFDLEYHVFTNSERILYETLLSKKREEKAQRDKIIHLLHDMQKDSWEQGISINISGGGMLFSSKKPLESRDIINISFTLEYLDQIKKINIRAIVIDSIASYVNPNTYRNRVEFINISNKDRESIISFIFEEQRKQMQKDNLK